MIFIFFVTFIILLLNQNENNFDLFQRKFKINF